MSPIGSFSTAKSAQQPISKLSAFLLLMLAGKATKATGKGPSQDVVGTLEAAKIASTSPVTEEKAEHRTSPLSGARLLRKIIQRIVKCPGLAKAKSERVVRSSLPFQPRAGRVL